MRSSFKIPKLWDDTTCFILGGGPSLAKVDVSRLQGKRVIAVNAAFRIAPFADVCWFGDGRFYDWNAYELADFYGLKITCADRLKWPPGILSVNRGRSMFGIDKDPNKVCWNKNSGASAINVAYHLGARKIVLLGYDMKLVNGQHNWHNHHKAKPADNIYENRFLQAFPIIKKDLDALGCLCVNATEDSALTTFPHMPFEEALLW